MILVDAVFLVFEFCIPLHAGGRTTKFEISREKPTLSPKEGICGDFGQPGLTKPGRGQTPPMVDKVLFPFTLKETERVEGWLDRSQERHYKISC